MRRAVATVLALALAAGPAAADNKPTAKQIAEARKHYAQGEKLHGEGKYLEAVGEYEIAYDLSRRPLLQYNIGQEYRLAGDKRKAIEHYERYLAEEAPGKTVPEAKAFVSALKRELELEDERARAEAARKAEEERKAREAAAAARPVVEPPQPKDLPPDGSRGRGLRIGGLATAGAGVALLGVGTVFALRSRSLSDQQYDGSRFDPALVDDGKTANRYAIISFVAGGAAVAAGGVLYYLGHRQGQEPRVTVTPSLAPGFVGGLVAGSW